MPARTIIVFGSVNLDLIARVETIARPGETVLATSTVSLFGGKGANQAVAAARAAGDSGPRVLMAAAVGDDAAGDAALANFAANGVGTECVRRVAGPTGWACVAVSADGENAITVAPGANAAATHDQVPEDLLGPGALVVLQMETPPAESLALARRARARGSQVILNLAPVPPGLDPALLRALVEATSILVTNEPEAVALSAILDGTGRPADVVMAALSQRLGLTAIVTLGARGATATLPDGTRLHVAARLITPVDTTGAGDTFVGVLASGVAEGRPMREALKRACVGASLACLAVGAQAAMPTAAALEAAAACAR
ncbi:MAG: PfkB family carbohydrate kinase [Acetobacteraceae bacterium]